MLSPTQTQKCKEQVFSVFRKFDVDGTGLISKKVLGEILVQIGVSERALVKIVDEGNAEEDGKVNYDRFLAYLFAPDMASIVAGILDHFDDLEDLAQHSISRVSSGDGFPKELIDMEKELEVRDPVAQNSSDTNQHTVGESARATITKQLRETPFLSHTHPLFMHGRAYNGPLEKPRKTWACDKPPRDDHDAPEWLTASEFQDTFVVMQAKSSQLASLMRLSKKTVAYTGAGISASVVGQAARSGTNTQGWVSKQHARPTFTHYALGFLGQAGLIHSWVQQNHDGLPQKAGFPQEHINEIHGSWYDPSNPVVKYSGSLHQRAFPWMHEDANTADLVLVLGTSLGGLNADQVATKAARRSLTFAAPEPGMAPVAGTRFESRVPGVTYTDVGTVLAAGEDGSLKVQFDEGGYLEPEVYDLPKGYVVNWLPGGSLGTICINLQQTEQDGKMSLRCFAKSDDLLRLLLEQLGIGLGRCQAPVWNAESVVLVPYDAEGQRLRDGEGKRMWLDLRNGQRVRLASDHNIQGAKQPQFMHIGATSPVTYKGKQRQPGIGRGTVIRRDEATSGFLLDIEGVEMRLGIWWLDAAARGGPEALPLVNESALFEGDTPALLHAEPKPKAKAEAKAKAKARARSKSPSAKHSSR